MEFSRDAARALHTYDFINTVNAVKQQHPQYTPGRIVDVLNTDVYADKRKGFKVLPMDVQLALYILRDECPIWPEGRLFYSIYKGIPVERDDYPDIIKDNYKTIKHLGHNLAQETESVKQHYATLKRLLDEVDVKRNEPKASDCLSYWKTEKTDLDKAVINVARKLLVTGHRLKSNWKYRLWFIEQDESVEIPVLFRKLNIPNCRNAVRVYVQSRKYRLCICTKRGFLTME